MSRARFSPARLATYAVAGVLLATPPLARALAVAFAEAGQKIDPVELPALAGGKAPLVSRAAKVNVFLFFRAGQERSIDALRQLAACQKEFAGKGVRIVGVVSGATPAAEVNAALSTAGASFPVLLDEGDKVYDALQIRVAPVAGVADGAGVLQAMEPYRQLDFGDVVRARVRFALGEIDRAGLEAVLNPAAAPLPGDDPMAKARRDVKMAKRLIEFGQLDAAVKQGQKALEQAPIAEAFPVLALAYAKLGNCAEAKKMIEQAQSALPQSPELPEARSLCTGK